MKAQRDFPRSRGNAIATRSLAYNAAFTPSDAALAHARVVVAPPDTNSDAVALQLDGKMINTLHLKQSRRSLLGPDRRYSNWNTFFLALSGTGEG